MNLLAVNYMSHVLLTRYNCDLHLDVGKSRSEGEIKVEIDEALKKYDVDGRGVLDFTGFTRMVPPLKALFCVAYRLNLNLWSLGVQHGKA